MNDEKEESHLWGFFNGGAELFALFLYPYIAVCYKHGVVPIGAFKFLQGKQ